MPTVGSAASGISPVASPPITTVVLGVVSTVEGVTAPAPAVGAPAPTAGIVGVSLAVATAAAAAASISAWSGPQAFPPTTSQLPIQVHRRLDLFL